MLRLLLTTLLIYGVHSKESIYDLLSNVGCDSFAGLLQSSGYMYSLGDDHKGTVFEIHAENVLFRNCISVFFKIKKRNNNLWDI